MLIALVNVRENSAAVSMTGWNPIYTDQYPGLTGGQEMKVFIYWRVATGTDPNTVTQSGTCSSMGAQIARFSGVDSTQPFENTPIPSGNVVRQNSGNIDTGAETTTINGAMLLVAAFVNDNRTVTEGAGWSQSFDTRLNVARDLALSLHYQVQATAGSASISNWDLSGGGNDENYGIIFALRPAATSGLTIAIPTGTVANDVMVASIAVRPSTVTITPPAGWTLVRRIDNANANSNSLAVYGRVAGGSEPAQYSWVISASTGEAGGIQSFSGVDNSSPVDVENGQNTASGLAHATPSVTTTVGNTVLVTSHAFSSAAAWTPPTGMTEGFDTASITVPNGGGISIEGNYAIQASAGATGAKTATASNSNDVGNAHILALRPAAPGLTIVKPAGTIASDVLVAGIAVQPQTAVVTPPSGWTLVRQINNPFNTPNSLYVYLRVAGAAEPASYTWSLSGFNDAVGGIQSFSGVDTASPIDVENGRRDNGLTHRTPSVNTSVANTMLVTYHGFASSATWTPPGGMTEAIDVASRAVPNANGVAMEGNWQIQAGTGATGGKTATASNNGDRGNAHITALRPGAGVPTPGSFNAFETSTAAGAITGVIRAKISGTAFSLDVVAIQGGAQLATFTDQVIVELLGNNALGVALDAQNCPTSFTLVQTVAPDPTITGGRSTVSFAAAPNSWRDVRVRVRWPTASPTVTACSTDNFAIRPNTFANFGASDTDWQTAGTTRVLNDITFGAVTHKAGRPFSIRADAVNAAGTPVITTNYTGTPTATLTTCAGAACTASVGTLSLGTTFAAGQLVSDVASYNEVGSFGLQLVDDTFASVDSADSTPAERNIVSVVVNAGRFVPDHFAVSLNTPTFGTACSTGGFTYLGQAFNYTVQPVITVTAQDFGNNTTTLYTGTWWRISSTSLTGKSYTAATGTLDTSGLPSPDPTIAPTGAGTGTLTFDSGTGVFFTRTTPVAPFDADVSLAINVIDVDGVAYGANPARFGQATAGNGIAFNNGKPMRFGRLRIGNANGSQLTPLPVLMEVQYFSGPPGNAFVTHTDDSCTALAATNLALSNFTQSLAACETAITSLSAFSNGRSTLTLAAPGSGNEGSVDLTVNLGSTGSGTTCTSVGGAPVPVTGANILFLKGNWTGGAYDQNPSGRATFGVVRGAEEVIFIRENF